MNNLTIVKGGEIIRNKDGENTNVTDFYLSHLMEPCVLEDGVTLRDILLLIQKEKEICSVILSGWTNEILEEAFQENPPKDDDIDTDMHYLELYWLLTAETGKKYTSVSGFAFPEFHGWGHVAPTEYNPDGWTGGIAVELTPVYHLMDIPVRLNDEFPICVEKDFSSQETITYKKPEYTLMHILYGIMWELTWFGSPKQRTNTMNAIQKSVDNIDGAGDLIPAEQVMADLRKRYGIPDVDKDEES